MVKNPGTTVATNPSAVRQVQKPVQSVAAVSKSQPTILPSTQINRQVCGSVFSYRPLNLMETICCKKVLDFIFVWSSLPKTMKTEFDVLSGRPSVGKLVVGDRKKRVFFVTF